MPAPKSKTFDENAMHLKTTPPPGRSGPRPATLRGEWLSPGVVARYFGVNHATVLSWIHRGLFDKKDFFRLPIPIHTRPHRIRKSAVLKLLDAIECELAEEESKEKEP